MASKVHTYDEASLMAVSKLVADHMTRITKCCVNCEKFDVRNEVCNANNRQRPPAHIMAFGCGWFQLNDIPF
jgi:hypothetical protein